MMQLTFLLLDVSRFSSFPNKTPKMVILPPPPKGGIIMFWMLLSQALSIPNPVTCSGSLLNFKKFQRDEARGNVGVLQVRKAEEAHGSQ